MEAMSEDVWQKDNVRTVVFLPNGLFGSKAAVIAELKRMDSMLENMSDTRLYGLWREHFWHVMIKSWQPFAKCDECALFRFNLFMAPKTDLENPQIEVLRAERRAHQARVTVGRLRYMLRATLAKTFPDKFLHICIDGMDNKKTHIPQCHGTLFAKDIDGTGMELQTKLLGALVDGQAFFTFLTFPTYVHGSGLTWTALLYILKAFKDAGKTVAPYLLLQLDNAGRDNKNQHAFAFLGYLVHIGVFKKVLIHFLPVGHTHAEIDQRFSVISQKIRAKDILTPAALQDHVGSLFRADSCFREDVILEQVADIGAFFDGTYHSFGGQGTFRDSNGRKRRVHAIKIENLPGTTDPVIVFKEHDESSEWRGDWLSHEPLRIFKDVSNLVQVLRARSLMQTDLVRIEVEELRKKVNKLLEVVKTPDVTEGGDGPPLSYQAVQKQKVDYEAAAKYWPGFIDKHCSVWEDIDKEVTRVPSSATFDLAPWPWPEDCASSHEDLSFAESLLQVIYMFIFKHV